MRFNQAPRRSSSRNRRFPAKVRERRPRWICTLPGAPFGKPSPVEVTTLGTSVVEVSTGGLYHACARKADNTVWCWGWNGAGQLGDGTMVDKALPIQVTALGTGTVEIAARAGSTYVRKGDGTVWGWGSNAAGPLGDGTLPIQVSGLGTGIVQISAGGDHTCARNGDGTLWCWGANDDGQIGDGTKVFAPSPVQVTALGTSVIEVSAGGGYTCARKGDGTLWCWGHNAEGELGDGTTLDKPSPVQVTALGTAVVEVAADDWHTCARIADGTVWCRGAAATASSVMELQSTGTPPSKPTSPALEPSRDGGPKRGVDGLGFLAPSFEPTPGLNAAHRVVGEADVPRQAALVGSIRPAPAAVMSGAVALPLRPERRTALLAQLIERVPDHDDAPAARSEAVVGRRRAAVEVASTARAHGGRPAREKRDQRQERDPTPRRRPPSRMHPEKHRRGADVHA